MGREISQVMGHLGAGWLERPKREQEERTDLLIKNMQLGKAEHVADIGAGSGYFSFRISPLIPEGRLYAVDISPQMLGIMRAKKHKGEFKKCNNRPKYNQKYNSRGKFNRLCIYGGCLPRILLPTRDGSIHF